MVETGKIFIQTKTRPELIGNLPLMFVGQRGMALDNDVHPAASG